MTRAPIPSPVRPGPNHFRPLPKHSRLLPNDLRMLLGHLRAESRSENPLACFRREPHLSPVRTLSSSCCHRRVSIDQRCESFTGLVLPSSPPNPQRLSPSSTMSCRVIHRLTRTLVVAPITCSLDPFIYMEMDHRAAAASGTIVAFPPVAHESPVVPRSRYSHRRGASYEFQHPPQARHGRSRP